MAARIHATEDSYRKQVRTRRGIRVLDALDTAGEEECPTIRDQLMRASHGFLLVYSITSRRSFEEVARYIEQIQRFKGVEHFAGVLIGNKSDLETERQVSFEEGQQLAERFELAFFETSGKSGMHAHEVRVAPCLCWSFETRLRHSHMKRTCTICL